MYIVTGAAGFIGHHVVRALNRRGIDDILAVDSLSDGAKFRNLAACRIDDYADSEAFRADLRARNLSGVDGILHLGACADTMETDGQYMLDANFTFSKELFAFALEQGVRFVYASTAALYGPTGPSIIAPEHEQPVNLYAYSKLLFDTYVRRRIDKAAATVAGLRYFNVYGPGEQHKGRMASMVTRLYTQLATTGTAKLFTGSDGYGDGEQKRDFVYVEDVAEATVSFLEGDDRWGLYNIGTGTARSFNETAELLIDRLGGGTVVYVPFPDQLRGKYQSFTEADLTTLRTDGCTTTFRPLEDGIDAALPQWREEAGTAGND
ncbi:MAG: ADP-glyceromanno-heptose 6-epimerase [Planctomycetota bacterium]